MSLAPPSVAELATFTGRESNTYGNYAVEALAQATLLFYLATDLSDYPDDTDKAKLAKYGILDMADKIYLSQPYKEAMASPYQSESIGSYSYSRMTNSVKKGDATGVMWFDMAVSKLRTGSSGIGASGSIQGMEWDGVEVGPTGKTRIIGASGSQPYGRNAWEIDTVAEEVIHHHPIV
jgi:hypothetical protein